MANALFIGVGSTGCDVLNRAKQIYFEYTKQRQPNAKDVRFMMLDTIDGNQTGEYVPLVPQNIEATLAGWDRGKYKWLPTQAAILNQHSGAGGQPVYGRVALWASEGVVRNKINQIYAGWGDPATNIYIVGSFVGGTGSGIFLDVACMVKQCTGNNNLYGMFLLPDAKNVGDNTLANGFQNNYASLKTLDTFSAGEFYECELPSGTTVRSNGAPFKHVEFISQNFSRQAEGGIGDLQGLVRTAGYVIMLRMLGVTPTVSPLQDTVNDRMVDFGTVASNGIFASIGLDVFQYPESLLEEYFSTSELESRLLLRWLDSAQYTDNNNVKRSVEDFIHSKMPLRTSYYLQDAVTSIIDKCEQGHFMNIKGARNAVDKMCVDKIADGTYKQSAGSVEDYVWSLFNGEGDFYNAIAAKKSDIEDGLIKSCYDYICNEMGQYQNLTIAGASINGLANAMKSLIDEWKQRYNLDGSRRNWDKKLQAEFVPQFVSSNALLYKLTFTYSDHLREGLSAIIRLAFFNVFIDVLDKVKGSLTDSSATPLGTTGGNITLPTLKVLKDITAKVNNLLDDKRDFSIVNRKAKIVGQLDNNGHPQFHLLFSTGRYQSDVKGAEDKYKNSNNPINYSDISSSNLWEYLVKNSEEVLFKQMTERAFDKISKMQLFGASNIVDLLKAYKNDDNTKTKVKDLLTNTEAGIYNKMLAMVSLKSNVQFIAHDKLKLIVISDHDETDANGIVNAMQGYKPSTNGSNYVYIKELKNTVVLYQEFCYMGSDGDNNPVVFNPLTDLSYQQQVKDRMPKDFNSNGLRLAYLTNEEFNNNKVNIK